MKLVIKNMVSIRCKMIVKSTLEALGLPYSSVDLGLVELKDDISIEQKARLKADLLQYGLELIEDRNAILIERIKQIIIEMVHYEDEMPKIKTSVYLSEKLHYNYTYLANLFARVTCSTIEHFIIAHKIEKVKELLTYDALSLTEISYKLQYSSVAHLSSQFRKLTGLTPSDFKKISDKRHMALKDVGILDLVPKQNKTDRAIGLLTLKSDRKELKIMGLG